MRLLRFLPFALLLAFELLSHSSFGQRHRKGQYAFSLQGGIMDRFPRGINLRADQQGSLVRTDFVRYTRSEHYWKIGYQYDRKFYQPLGVQVISERHTLGIDYAPISLHNYRRTFYISPVLGIFTGLEIVNQDRHDLPIGFIGAQSHFTFGGNIGLEAEVFLTDRISLIGGITERWYAVSDLNRLHTQAQLGLRFTLDSF